MSNEAFLGNKQVSARRGGFSVQSNDPFYLTHHREQWELVETNGKYEFLPQFGKLIEMAGVNGVESVRGGVDSVMARAELQEQGITVLPMEMGYLTRFPTKTGGWYYTLKWNSPKELAGRLLSKLDVESWNNFRNDPDWAKVVEDSHKDGLIVKNVENQLLNPTDYSPLK